MRTLMIATFLAYGQDDTLREQYEQRRLGAPQTVQGQLDLAKWCESHHMHEEAVTAHEQVLELDPENATARRALGYKRVKGQWTRDEAAGHPKVDQKKVDEAIRKGCEFMIAQVDKPLGFPHLLARTRLDELVLLTLIHGAVDRKDPQFQKLLDRVLKLPLETTYNVSLKAMCLAALDPGKYQQQIAQCAQFLVDNQCENGQWTYGKPDTSIPTEGKFQAKSKGPIQIPTGARKPNVPGQIEIKKGKGSGDKAGDNSNSQYAALGLRACLSAFVVVPKETIQSAHDWWEKCQKADGGWSYDMRDNTWGSMTAGGLGSIVIYKYYLNRVWGLKEDWRGAPSVAKGIQWMGEHLSFDANPDHPVAKEPHNQLWLYYWIYGIERAGRLAETEQFGSHEWYVEGAHWLLPRQHPDGTFHLDSTKASYDVIAETCFAILFLRRATPSVTETIESVDSKNKPGK